MNRISVEKAIGEDVFESLREEWQNLYAATGCSPFLSCEWLSTWFKWFGAGRTPFILKAYRQDELIGLLPLCLQGKKVLGMKLRRLSFLGEEAGGADYLDLIAKPEDKAEILYAILDFLKKEDCFDLICLENLASDSPTAEFLQSFSRQKKSPLRCADTTAAICPQINLSAGWEMIFKQSKRASNFKRRLKQLEKMSEFEFRSVTSPLGVNDAFERFYHLHEKRWAKDGGSELSGHPRLVSFQRDLISSLSQTGLLRFDELWVEGECRATVYGLDDGKTFYYYNSGYDLDWGNYSVGLVLIGLSVKNAVERGNSLYDFLRGEETYKFDWANQKSELKTLNLSRGTIPALAHEGISQVLLNLKNFSKIALPANFTEILKTRRRAWKRNYQLSELKADKLPRFFMKNKVSIVIIGRNEEQGIGKCLDAVLAAADQIGGAEIIYVDSASTDNTISIVKSYEIRVLSLKPEWKLSPSAGRFIGSHYAEGEFILFVDADTLVYKDFLPNAIEIFQNNLEIGGIGGQIDDLDENGGILANVEERFDSVADVKWLRGPCCFYRKEALDKAGTFNPHLAVEEEAELGLRLVKSGWKLQIIPAKMACHTRCFHMQTLKSVVSMFKRDISANRLGAFTNTIAYNFMEGNGLAFCRLRLKTMILFLVWFLLLSFCIFLPEFLYPKTVFALLLFSGISAIYSKKRSFNQTFVFISNKIISFIDLAAGVHKIRLKNKNHYPLDAVEHKTKNRKKIHKRLFVPPQNFQKYEFRL